MNKIKTWVEETFLPYRNEIASCIESGKNASATFIAGVYGMNFEYIPAVEFRHGYFVVLAMMIATVVAQLIFFYSRGWFR